MATINLDLTFREFLISKDTFLVIKKASDFSKAFVVDCDVQLSNLVVDVLCVVQAHELIGTIAKDDYIVESD